MYFPKKSHHGYYDDSLKVRFDSRGQKKEYLKKHGLFEADPASRTHMKRVKDFVAWCKDEKRKDSNFVPRNEEYPN